MYYDIVENTYRIVRHTDNNGRTRYIIQMKVPSLWKYISTWGKCDFEWENTEWTRIDTVEAAENIVRGLDIGKDEVVKEMKVRQYELNTDY